MLNSESESRLSTLNYNMPIRGKTDQQQKEDMVVTILKSLLESQTLQETIKSDVDDAIKASVDRISINMDILEGRIHDLECKLEKRETELLHLRKENDDFQSKLQQCLLENKILERYSRPNCLRVSGLPEQQNENTDVLIKTSASESPE